MSNGNIDKLYKKTVKPNIGEENSLYFIGDESSEFVDFYVTDRKGKLIPVVNNQRTTSIKQTVDDLGWVQLSNTTYTKENPYILEDDLRTILPITPTSVLGEPYYKPEDKPTAGNKFKPNNSGDIYLLRIGFKIDTTFNNQQGFLDVDIGGTQGVIWEKSYDLIRGKEYVPFTEQVMVYSLDTFLKNGAAINFKVKGGAEVYDIVTVIFKSYNGGNKSI